MIPASATSTRKATPDDVLAVLRDWHRLQCQAARSRPATVRFGDLRTFADIARTISRQAPAPGLA